MKRGCIERKREREQDRERDEERKGKVRGQWYLEHGIETGGMERLKYFTPLSMHIPLFKGKVVFLI